MKIRVNIKKMSISNFGSFNHPYQHSHLQGRGMEEKKKKEILLAKDFNSQQERAID